MADLTMLDIAKRTNNDPTIGLIEENIKASPEVARFPFRTIKGTAYKAGIRTGLPTTGFRSANEGFTPSKSTLRQVLFEAAIFGNIVEVDQAVADADEEGAESVQAMESSGTMLSAMRNLGSQIWYGLSNDGKGFPGLKSVTPFGATTVAGDALTVNAGGTTATTASSVYFVRFGKQDVMLFGGNDKAFTLGEFNLQQIVAADGVKKLMAYVAGLTSWIGLQTGNENSVRRIANLTADATHTLTDAFMALAMATFPVGFVPDMIFMSRRSCSQLQASRTVVLQGQGTNRPDQPTLAPRPTSYDNVPIEESDSILNTDAIET